MKKTFKVLLNIFALFSLIACVDDKSSSKESSSSLEPSSDSTSSATNIASDTSFIPSQSSSSEEVRYHVTFVNYDDTTLYETDVLEGEEAIYRGETPTRPDDDEFTYEFNGWDLDLTNITSDITTVAQYKATGKEGWGPINWFD